MNSSLLKLQPVRIPWRDTKSSYPYTTLALDGLSFSYFLHRSCFHPRQINSYSFSIYSFDSSVNFRERYLVLIFRSIRSSFQSFHLQFSTYSSRTNRFSTVQNT